MWTLTLELLFAFYPHIISILNKHLIFHFQTFDNQKRIFLISLNFIAIICVSARGRIGPLEGTVVKFFIASQKRKFDKDKVIEAFLCAALLWGYAVFITLEYHWLGRTSRIFLHETRRTHTPFYFWLIAHILFCHTWLSSMLIMTLIMDSCTKHGKPFSHMKYLRESLMELRTGS